VHTPDCWCCDILYVARISCKVHFAVSYNVVAGLYNDRCCAYVVAFVRFHSVEKFEHFKSPVQRVSEQRLNGLAAGHPVKTERASPPATAIPLVHPVPA